LDKVSSPLTGKPFDSFLSANGDLLKSVRTQYQSSGEALAKDFFVKGLFHKRNRIVHFGKIDFQKSEAGLCFALATALWHILVAMDAHCYRRPQPYAGLIMDASGNLYGTTENGGSHQVGTVFSISTAGTETVLHNFNTPEGANPYASVMMDAKGNLYGTTYDGGSHGGCDNNVACGTVWKVTP
jgi:uncharacterized repeat protein (TIGR03803 family)